MSVEAAASDVSTAVTAPLLHGRPQEGARGGTCPPWKIQKRVCLLDNEKNFSALTRRILSPIVRDKSLSFPVTRNCSAAQQKEFLYICSAAAEAVAARKGTCKRAGAVTQAVYTGCGRFHDDAGLPHIYSGNAVHQFF